MQKSTHIQTIDIEKHPRHIPVLVEEITCMCLDSKLHMDCNLGDAGHIEQLLKKNHHVHIHAIDADQKAVERTKYFLGKSIDKVTIHIGNFKDQDTLIDKKLVQSFDSILFDLGLSTYQLGESQRGFSFKYDEPLDMRFGESDITAHDIVNLWDPENIALILRTYADETSAWKIAKHIEKKRVESPIETSKQLADIICEVIPKKSAIHPATKTFQAIRIAVNGELQALEKGLEHAKVYLAPQGKIIVISYHSLEDRIVKHIFKKWEDEDFGFRYNKKIITPSLEEIKKNPKSRSAKLRVFIKNS